MRVFVTGGTGFLGSHLMRILNERGHETTLLVRPTSNLELIQKLTFSKVEGDITDRQSMFEAIPENTDVIFHNASRMSNWGHKKRFWPQNVEGTLNALEAARQKDIPTFIYTSSGVVYGFPSEPVTEDTPLNPANVYAESKAVAEQHVLDYHRDHGIKSVIVRPPMMLGRCDTHSGPLLRKMVHDNQFFMFGKCDRDISIAHAEDVARCLVDVSENIHRTNGEAYNVVSFDKSWHDFCAEFLEEINLGVKMKTLPYSICYGMAAVGE
ncbi:MAG: NAD-dependent epimerase/dehydratase family protein, partial [Candidatus Thorarchaeota archaeon]